MNGELSFEDGYTWEEAAGHCWQKLKPVFRDGKMLVDESLATIRNRLHNNQF